MYARFIAAIHNALCGKEQPHATGIAPCERIARELVPSLFRSDLSVVDETGRAKAESILKAARHVTADGVARMTVP